MTRQVNSYILQKRKKGRKGGRKGRERKGRDRKTERSCVPPGATGHISKKKNTHFPRQITCFFDWSASQLETYVGSQKQF